MNLILIVQTDRIHNSIYNEAVDVTLSAKALNRQFSEESDCKKCGKNDIYFDVKVNVSNFESEFDKPSKVSNELL